jgi:hypothetical protein
MAAFENLDLWRGFEGSPKGPLLFVAYRNDIWWDVELTVGLPVNHCEMYKMYYEEDIEMLQ